MHLRKARARAVGVSVRIYFDLFDSGSAVGILIRSGRGGSAGASSRGPAREALADFDRVWEELFPAEGLRDVVRELQGPRTLEQAV